MGKSTTRCVGRKVISENRIGMPHRQADFENRKLGGLEPGRGRGEATCGTQAGDNDRKGTQCSNIKAHSVGHDRA